MRMHAPRGFPSLRQTGLTMVELMVALTISFILLAGVLQVYITSKATYRMAEAMARVQENGRYATDFLTRDIRLAGFKGCATGSSETTENILNDQNNYGWDLTNMLSGNEATGNNWTPALNAAISGVVTGTDVILVRYLSGSIDLVPPYSDSGQLFIDINNSSNITDGEILMATDCKQSSIFQATNVQTAGGKINVVHSGASITPGNSTPQLANSYGADAQLARLTTRVYYIKNNASNIPSLYRSSLIATGGTTASLGNEEEIVEGVANLQVLYGEKTDSDSDMDANRYVTANNVTDWENVVSVRISLLLNTDEDIASETVSYYYNGGTITPAAGDRKLRRVFSTTVNLRNRTL